MPRFVTKIVGGKLVTVPEYRDSTSSRQSGYNLNATYPWGRYDSGPTHKIGSRTYPVLPPISDGKVHLHVKGNTEFLKRATFLMFLKGVNHDYSFRGIARDIISWLALLTCRKLRTWW